MLVKTQRLRPRQTPALPFPAQSSYSLIPKRNGRCGGCQMKFSTSFALILPVLSMPHPAVAIGQTRYILDKADPGAFAMVQANAAAAIYIDSADWPGVARAATD